MELADLLRTRRMCRRFDPDAAVFDDQVRAIVDAAVRAPSAGFTQGVSYLVLRDAERDAYWQATAADPPTAWVAGLRTAPVLVTVWTSEAAYLDRYAEPDKGWTDRDPARWSAPYWWVDAGMGVMAALLRVTDLGLGACFFGVPPDRQDAVRARFGVPAEQQSVGVLAVGVPAGVPATPRRPRRPRAAVVHHGTWPGPES